MAAPAYPSVDGQESGHIGDTVQGHIEQSVPGFREIMDELLHDLEREGVYDSQHRTHLSHIFCPFIWRILEGHPAIPLIPRKWLNYGDPPGSGRRRFATTATVMAKLYTDPKIDEIWDKYINKARANPGLIGGLIDAVVNNRQLSEENALRIAMAESMRPAARGSAAVPAAVPVFNLSRLKSAPAPAPAPADVPAAAVPPLTPEQLRERNRQARLARFDKKPPGGGFNSRRKHRKNRKTRRKKVSKKNKK
jgi:hypothetical protein